MSNFHRLTPAAALAAVLVGTAAGDSNTPDVANQYDALGRMDNIVQVNQSKLAYTYNADLSLDNETLSYDLDRNGVYEFIRLLDRRNPDSFGRPTGYDLKDGATVEAAAALAYHPDTGRPATVGNGTQTFTYAYMANSHLIDTVTGPQHLVDNGWELKRDVLTEKTNRHASAAVSLFQYTVNAIGQRTNGFNIGGGSGYSLAWFYDGFGQLTKADDAANVSDRVYEYDAIGNRKKSADGLTLPGADNYVSNTLNQYAAVPLAPTPPEPGYDLDGNALAYPVPAAPTQNATLAWDGENRLLATTVAGTVTTYQYDALSRRIAQATGATREVTLYDGWNVIAEYEGAAFTLHAANLWGTDLSGSPQGAGGVGGLLAVQKLTGPATGLHYPLYDGNGNITEYLNAAGAVVAHYKYDPFGRIYDSSGALKDAFPYRFSTKRLDPATGLYYYGYRYYDPITGRWLSRDPIEEEGGLNLSDFLRNQAVTTIDVNGLMVFSLEAQYDVSQNKRFDDLSLKMWGESNEKMDKFIQRMSQVTDVMFDTAKHDKVVTLNGKAFSGSKDQLVEMAKREKDSKHILGVGMGREDILSKLQEFATLATEDYDIVVLRSHGLNAGGDQLNLIGIIGASFPSEQFYDEVIGIGKSGRSHRFQLISCYRTFKNGDKARGLESNSPASAYGIVNFNTKSFPQVAGVVTGYGKQAPPIVTGCVEIRLITAGSRKILNHNFVDNGDE